MECVDREVGWGGSDMTFHVSFHRFVIYHCTVLSIQLTCLHKHGGGGVE